jgi:hypothetical protein
MAIYLMKPKTVLDDEIDGPPAQITMSIGLIISSQPVFVSDCRRLLNYHLYQVYMITIACILRQYIPK